MIDRRSVLAGIVLLATVAPLAAAPDAVSAGLYAGKCALCHGVSGGGDGAASTMLTPRPTVFANPEYWKAADREAMAETVAKGKKGTAMVPFSGQLSAEQIKGLVAYIETFAEK